MFSSEGNRNLDTALGRDTAEGRSKDELAYGQCEKVLPLLAALWLLISSLGLLLGIFFVLW